MLVVVYRRFEKAYRSHLQKSTVRADGADRPYRNFGEKLPTNTGLQTKGVKTLIAMTFEWKFIEKPRINLVFLAFEKLIVTNKSTVPLGENNYKNYKSVQNL
jgi:hypothetical protein